MSSSKDDSYKYEKEIKLNFENYSKNNSNKLSAQNLDDFIENTNSKIKNPFIYNSIKTFTNLKQAENDLNISPEEYITFMNKQINNDKNKKKLKNIFDIFCDDNKSDKISWNKFPLIAEELGNENLADTLMNLLRQSKLYSKNINFEEFCEIMNSDSDKEDNIDNEESIDNNNDNNKIIYNKKNNNKYSQPYEENNLKINEYIENYEEKPTYKQRKMMKKNSKENNEEDITSSSRSINKISDDIIIEEKSYENSNEDEKVNKRYHRRYRSKKDMNINYNNKENNNSNINENINYKSVNKYRKKHLNH